MLPFRCKLSATPSEEDEDDDVARREMGTMTLYSKVTCSGANLALNRMIVFCSGANLALNPMIVCSSVLFFAAREIGNCYYWRL
jgi:hypothetical protein